MGNEQSKNGESDTKISSFFPTTVKFVKMQNLGNTCYMNSVLQAFLNSEYVLKFLEKVKETIGKKEISKSISDSLLYELMNIVDFRKKMKEQEVIFQPEAFLNKLTTQMPQFVKGQQHDAHELYVSLLDSFDSTINEINKAYNSELPLFSSLSKGNSLSEIQCLMCGNASRDFEEFESFFLSIKEKTSLTYRLKVMQAPEYMNGTGKRFCSKCKINQEMRSVMTYTHIPEIVVFQLQRFEYDRKTKSLKKLNQHIPFPSELTFNNRYYKLKTVIVHIGESITFGHFVALMLIHEKWVLASDSKFTLLDDAEVDEYFACGTVSGSSIPSAYLLFYEEIKQS